MIIKPNFYLYYFLLFYSYPTNSEKQSLDNLYDITLLYLGQCFKTLGLVMPQVGKISSCGDNLSFLSFTALLVIRFPLIYITFKLFIIYCRGYTKSSTFIGTQFGINKPFLYFALTIYMLSKKMYLMNPYLILKHYTTLLVFIRGCSSISRSLWGEG